MTLLRDAQQHYLGRRRCRHAPPGPDPGASLGAVAGPGPAWISAPRWLPWTPAGARSGQRAALVRGGLREGQLAVGAVEPPHEVRVGAHLPRRRRRLSTHGGHGEPRDRGTAARSGSRQRRVTGENRRESLGGPRPREAQQPLRSGARGCGARRRASTMRPRSRTTILSAFCTVDSRCAITMVVRRCPLQAPSPPPPASPPPAPPETRRSRASCTTCSLLLSSACRGPRASASAWSQPGPPSSLHTYLSGR